MGISTVRGLSLCSGVGGLDLGVGLALRSLGVDHRTVCYVEREAYAAAVLAARMEDESLAQAPVWSDLRTFGGRPWRGAVDLVTAGYPCQPFSLAGVRRGESDPRHVWPDVARIVDEARPALCFCENVSAHLSLGFDTVVQDMESMGYIVAAGVFTAWSVGAPHQRERLFWLATNASYRDEPRLSWRGSKASEHYRSCATNAADAPSEQRGVPRQSRERRCVEVGAADADRDGLRWSPKRDGEPESRREAAPIGNDAVRRDLASPDAVGHRPQGQRTAGTAPGPAFRNRAWDWREAPPPIHRVDDGVAHRVDRLRACGNGVVPQVARDAFLALVGEIFG